MNHTWPFFNAQFSSAQFGSGADQVEPLKGPSATTTEIGVTNSSVDNLHKRCTNQHISSKDAKKLAPYLTQSRSFGKDDTTTAGPNVAQRGYRTFTPGDYLYNFELPIDSASRNDLCRSWFCQVRVRSHCRTGGSV